MNNHRIAVTAASGRLGTAIINKLKEEIPNENIIGIARSPEKARSLGVEIRKGDYNSKDDFLHALQGIDALLMVSGSEAPPVKRIPQHRNVIEAAREVGVKKLVYTSVISASGNIDELGLVGASNRQTEEDIKSSGLQWAIGRNGLYVEMDLGSMDAYKQSGTISNSAAEGKCGYTTRRELACAYFKLLTNEHLNGKIYNLFGEPIGQAQLVNAINKAYKTDLKYTSVPPNQYTEQLKAELGEMVGTVIGGIYEGIKNGKYDHKSDFSKVAGRPHQSIDEMITDFIKNNSHSNISVSPK